MRTPNDSFESIFDYSTTYAAYLRPRSSTFHPHFRSFESVWHTRRSNGTYDDQGVSVLYLENLPLAAGKDRQAYKWRRYSSLPLVQ
jgi:hypothetical protein